MSHDVPSCAARLSMRANIAGSARRARRARLLLPLVMLVLLAPATRAVGPSGPPPPGVPAADSTRDTTAAQSEPRRKTMAYELVKFGRNVHVHEDEVVRGDIVLIGGELRVDGEIAGGAIVIGGNLHAGPQARIQGQAVAVAGRVTKAPGAEVADAVSLSVLSAPVFVRFAAMPAGELIGDVLKTLVLALLALPLCVWLRAPVEHARAQLDTAPLRCLGLGVLALPAAAFAIVVIGFVLALTLVGVPVALVLVAIALAVTFVAFCVGAATIGARVRATLPRLPRRLVVSLMLGLVCLRLPELVADIAALLTPTRPLRALRVLDTALEVAAIAAGLGALLWVAWSGVASRQAAPARRAVQDLGAPA